MDMFLKITKTKYKNKTYKSAKIVESYTTKDGKKRHKVIKNLGSIKSNEDLIKYQESLSRINKGEILVDLNKINIEKSKNFGIYYTVNQILQKFEIDKILENYLNSKKHQFDVYQIIQALMVMYGMKGDIPNQ